MTEAEKRKLNQQRQEISLKNTFFNRYLLLRYSLALFFFSNLYWLLIQLTTRSWLLVLPSILIVLTILACIEQFKLYGKKEVRLTHTKRAMQVQVGVQVFSVIGVMTPWFSALFPIFATSVLARLFILTLLGIGLALLLFNLRRMEQIETNTDRAYLRYRQMEKSILR